MDIKKLLTVTLGVFFIAQTTSFAMEEADFFKPVEVKNGSNLSVIDCVSTAFQNSPKIRRRKYELDIAKSNVGITK